MITVTKTFELYEFDELFKEAQDKAVNDHIEYIIETMDENSPYYHCAEEMERMQTPWFLGECIYDTHKEDIINGLQHGGWYFFKDGSVVPADYYPKEGGKIRCTT